MKKGLYLLLFCLLTVSCSVHDWDPRETEDVFHATLESNADPDTRVYIDEHNKILWDEDDRVSIFNKKTYNQQFRFTGRTGANSGDIEKVPNSSFVTGGDFPFIVAVYPYQKSTNITNDDVLHLTLPAVQTYREGSFGRGANTMVAVTEDEFLSFKNAGGFMVLKFYGDDVSVTSITLENLGTDRLSGKAYWKPTLEAYPEVTMDVSDQEGGTTVTLSCSPAVHLGSTKDDATVFWLVVPPVSFTQGFRLTVELSDGRVFVKEATDPSILPDLYVERNGILRIGAINVAFPSQS